MAENVDVLKRTASDAFGRVDSLHPPGEVQTAVHVFCTEHGVTPGMLAPRCAVCLSEAVRCPALPPAMLKQLASREHKPMGLCMLCFPSADSSQPGTRQPIELLFRCRQSVDETTTCNRVCLPLPHVKENTDAQGCMVCGDEAELLVTFTPCGDGLCVDCFQQQATMAIGGDAQYQLMFDPDTKLFTLSCPAHRAESFLKDTYLFRTLPEEVYHKYTDVVVVKKMERKGGVVCPLKGCTLQPVMRLAVPETVTGKVPDGVECCNCNGCFCRKCYREWQHCVCELFAKLKKGKLYKCSDKDEDNNKEGEEPKEGEVAPGDDNEEPNEEHDEDEEVEKTKEENPEDDGDDKFMRRVSSTGHSLPEPILKATTNYTLKFKHGGEEFLLHELDGNTTMLRIKEIIEERKGIPVFDQRLVHASHTLPDQLTVHQAYSYTLLWDGVCIHVVIATTPRNFPGRATLASHRDMLGDDSDDMVKMVLSGECNICPYCRTYGLLQDGCQFVTCLNKACRKNYCNLCGTGLPFSAQHWSHYQGPGCTGPFGLKCLGASDGTGSLMHFVRQLFPCPPPAKIVIVNVPTEQIAYGATIPEFHCELRDADDNPINYHTFNYHPVIISHVEGDGEMAGSAAVFMRAGKSSFSSLSIVSYTDAPSAHVLSATYFHLQGLCTPLTTQFTVTVGPCSSVPELVVVPEHPAANTISELNFKIDMLKDGEKVNSNMYKMIYVRYLGPVNEGEQPARLLGPRVLEVENGSVEFSGHLKPEETLDHPTDHIIEVYFPVCGSTTVVSQKFHVTLPVLTMPDEISLKAVNYDSDVEEEEEWEKEAAGEKVTVEEKPDDRWGWAVAEVQKLGYNDLEKVHQVLETFNGDVLSAVEVLAAEPKPVPDWVLAQWSMQLEILHGMGFEDDSQLCALLHELEGNVESAIDAVLEGRQAKPPSDWSLLAPAPEAPVAEGDGEQEDGEDAYVPSSSEIKALSMGAAGVGITRSAYQIVCKLVPKALGKILTVFKAQQPTTVPAMLKALEDALGGNVGGNVKQNAERAITNVATGGISGLKIDHNRMPKRNWEFEPPESVNVALAAGLQDIFAELLRQSGERTKAKKRADISPIDLKKKFRATRDLVQFMDEAILEAIGADRPPQPEKVLIRKATPGINLPALEVSFVVDGKPRPCPHADTSLSGLVVRLQYLEGGATITGSPEYSVKNGTALIDDIKIITAQTKPGKHLFEAVFQSRDKPEDEPKAKTRFWVTTAASPFPPTSIRFCDDKEKPISSLKWIKNPLHALHVTLNNGSGKLDHAAWKGQISLSTLPVEGLPEGVVAPRVEETTVAIKNGKAIFNGLNVTKISEAVQVITLQATFPAMNGHHELRATLEIRMALTPVALRPKITLPSLVRVGAKLRAFSVQVYAEGNQEIKAPALNGTIVQLVLESDNAVVLTVTVLEDGVANFPELEVADQQDGKPLRGRLALLTEAVGDVGPLKASLATKVVAADYEEEEDDLTFGGLFGSDDEAAPPTPPVKVKAEVAGAEGDWAVQDQVVAVEPVPAEAVVDVAEEKVAAEVEAPAAAQQEQQAEVIPVEAGAKEQEAELAAAPENVEPKPEPANPAPEPEPLNDNPAAAVEEQEAKPAAVPEKVEPEPEPKHELEPEPVKENPDGAAPAAEQAAEAADQAAEAADQAAEAADQAAEAAEHSQETESKDEAKPEEKAGVGVPVELIGALEITDCCGNVDFTVTVADAHGEACKEVQGEIEVVVSETCRITLENTKIEVNDGKASFSFKLAPARRGLRDHVLPLVFHPKPKEEGATVEEIRGELKVNLSSDGARIPVAIKFTTSDDTEIFQSGESLRMEIELKDAHHSRAKTVSNAAFNATLTVTHISGQEAGWLSGDTEFSLSNGSSYGRGMVINTNLSHESVHVLRVTYPETLGYGPFHIDLPYVMSGSSRPAQLVVTNAPSAPVCVSNRSDFTLELRDRVHNHIRGQGYDCELTLEVEPGQPEELVIKTAQKSFRRGRSNFPTDFFTCSHEGWQSHRFVVTFPETRGMGPFSANLCVDCWGKKQVEDEAPHRGGRRNDDEDDDDAGMGLFD